MSDNHECEKVCSAPCASVCPQAGQADHLCLGEALGRFEREAVPGVCDTGRYRCRYFVWGEGPPLVFVHGLADTSRSFVLPAALLSRSFRCVAYDLPTGDGDGACLRRTTHADLVADLWALLDHLGLKQSYLFASSFGSTVALAALHARPGRLPRAVLQAGLAHKRLSWSERLAAWLLCLWRGRVRSLPGRLKVMHNLHHAPFVGRSPELWRHFLDYTGEVPTRAVGRQARLLHRVDLRSLLGEIRQPVLLVCGDRDPVVDGPATDELLHGLPNAGRVVLQGCGHVPSLTHPEALAELVRRFLTPPAPAERGAEEKVSLL